MEDVLEAIIEIVGGYPDGVSIEQIEKALASAPPRRTLQRYLAQLAKNGQLIIEGNTKGRRYKI
ncbi:MAG TPA: hypothetical protein VLF94_07950, partial [Chlamydiales bacterium]|nr:hypothetical protein [Chlamydiales bacterium]